MSPVSESFVEFSPGNERPEPGWWWDDGGEDWEERWRVENGHSVCNWLRHWVVSSDKKWGNYRECREWHCMFILTKRNYLVSNLETGWRFLLLFFLTFVSQTLTAALLCSTSAANTSCWSPTHRIGLWKLTKIIFVTFNKDSQGRFQICKDWFGLRQNLPTLILQKSFSFQHLWIKCMKW